MQGDTGRRKRRKRKKSKFGLYLYAIIVMLLTVANITLAALLVTHVQNIKVTGTHLSQESDIISWIKEDTFTVNSIYTLIKFKTGSYELPKYLESVEVSLDAPWKVRVDVTEKQIVGCIVDGTHYVYFDKDGLVLRKISEYEQGIPIIEGIQVKNTKKYENLEIDNKKVFSYIVSLTDEVKEKNLKPDRMVWEDNSMNLYFEQVCVRLGRTNFELKIEHLAKILPDLEGESGTLQMEYFNSDRKNISFEKNYVNHF